MNADPATNQLTGEMHSNENIIIKVAFLIDFFYTVIIYRDQLI